MIIVNADRMILGRLASYVAKKSLIGEQIIVVNCEKAVISGSKSVVIRRYNEKFERGAPLKGPYYPRMPDRLVRRAIRDMLPYKFERGRKAFERIKCYISVPEEYKNRKMEKVDGADIAKTKSLKYVEVGEISRLCRGLKL